MLFRKAGFLIAYMFEEELLISGLLSVIPTGLLGIVACILTVMATYTIFSRRELKKPWLTSISVVIHWLLGSFFDHYQYVVSRKLLTQNSLRDPSLC